MSNVPALSTELLSQAEGLREAWERATVDRHLCPGEIATIGVQVIDLTQMAREVDLAQATGLAIMRRGIDARRPRDLMIQLEEQATA